MKIEDVFVMSIPEGKDIVKEIVKFCEEIGVMSGEGTGIGALTNVEIGYFDRKRKEYIREEINEQVELLSCIGNITMKEGKPFTHLHVVLGKRDFSVVGGHLFRGEVFVCEIVVKKFSSAIERILAPNGLYIIKQNK